MSSVVVSYAKADAARAKAVAEGLSRLGFGVVETGLDQPAPLTLPRIVLWSKAADATPRLRRPAEALIVARLDPVDPPRFRGAVAVNLQSWRGRPDHRGWRAIVSALAATHHAATATGEAVSSPPPVAPSSSVVDDAAAKPRDRGAGWIIAGVALKVLALAGLGAAAWFALRG